MSVCVSVCVSERETDDGFDSKRMRIGGQHEKSNPKCPFQIEQIFLDKRDAGSPARNVASSHED